MRCVRIVFALAVLAFCAPALAQGWPGVDSEYQLAFRRVTEHVHSWSTVVQPAVNVAGSSTSSATMLFDPSVGDSSEDASVELYACATNTTDKTACRIIAAPVPPNRVVEATLQASESYWRLVVAGATAGGDVARATLTVTEAAVSEEATLE